MTNIFWLYDIIFILYYLPGGQVIYAKWRTCTTDGETTKIKAVQPEACNPECEIIHEVVNVTENSNIVSTTTKDYRNTEVVDKDVMPPRMSACKPARCVNVGAKSHDRCEKCQR